MLDSSRGVANAGAHFAICPDNSCHLSWNHFVRDSPIPWLHIAEVVAREAQSKGFKKSALLGTRFTMTGPVYPEMFSRFKMEVLSPSAQDQKIVDDVIFE